MAAIIEFPKEASIWRHDRARLADIPVGLEGNVLLFTGVRYGKDRMRKRDCEMEPVDNRDDVTV